MTAEFRELSQLWKEQVDALEDRAALRSLAEEIQRAAMRRRIGGIALSCFGIGLCTAVLLVEPMPMPMTLTIGVGITFMMWAIWKERKFFKATEALANCPPRLYPRAASKNIRAELRLLTILLWAAVPIGAFIPILGIATRESIGLGAAALELAGAHWQKLAWFVAGVFLIEAYFIRERGQMREQLRRLEAMNRELEMEEARDLTEEP